MEQRSATTLSSAGAAMIMNKSSKSTAQTLTLDHVSPATRLLEKRRQMFEVQEALDAQKEEFARREDAFHRREEGLRKKDLELQESLIKFNKFLQENESKRNRAMKRASEEVKQRVAKEQEVLKLREQLTSLQSENEKLLYQVKHKMKYMRYLEMVQEQVAEDYPEVSDLVNRYHTLKQTNEDLRKNQMGHEEENETKRIEVAAYQKEKANETLTFNNKIASLQRELELDESNVIRLQQEADTTLRMTTQKTLALGQIFMAVGNLVQRCTSGIHGQILKHMEVHNQNNNNASHGNSDGGAGTCTSPTNGSNDQENSSGSGGASSSCVSDGNGATSTNAENNAMSHAGKILEEDAIRHGLKAMADLDVVAAYMVDFTAIVQARIEYQRAQKKALQAASAAGNLNSVLLNGTTMQNTNAFNHETASNAASSTMSINLHNYNGGNMSSASIPLGSARESRASLN